jgi:hypothetical protein
VIYKLMLLYGFLPRGIRSPWLFIIIFFSSWSLINICFLFLLHLGVHVATIICGGEPLLYLSTFWGKKTLLCLHLCNGIVIPSHHAAQAYSMKRCHKYCIDQHHYRILLFTFAVTSIGMFLYLCADGYGYIIHIQNSY